MPAPLAAVDSDIICAWMRCLSHEQGKVSVADTKYSIGWSFVYDVPVIRKKKKKYDMAPSGSCQSHRNNCGL